MSLSDRVNAALAVSLAALVAVWPSAGQAQAWQEYANLDYRFSTMFPGEPSVRDFSYTTANGVLVPAREFRAERGEGRYSMIVVDFSAHESEEDGAVAHAAAAIRQKGTPRYDEFAQLNGIPGHALSIVEPDGRQILASVYLHDHRLYIAEGSEAADSLPPVLFSQSTDITDEHGVGINLNPGGATSRAQLLQQQQEAEQQQQ